MMNKKRNTIHDGPDPVDVHVGFRMRSRRAQLGLSQGALAEQVGITFQQIQKYERGANRVSASMLFNIARCLKAPIPYFFQGLPDVDSNMLEPAEPEPHQAYAISHEGQRLLNALGLLPEQVRKRLVALTISIAHQQADQDGSDDEG